MITSEFNQIVRTYARQALWGFARGQHNRRMFEAVALTPGKAAATLLGKVPITMLDQLHPRPPVDVVLKAFRDDMWQGYISEPLQLRVQADGLDPASLTVWDPAFRGWSVLFSSSGELELDLLVLLQQVAHIRLQHVSQDSALPPALADLPLGDLAMWLQHAVRDLTPGNQNALHSQTAEQDAAARDWANQELPFWVARLAEPVQAAIEKETAQRARPRPPEDPQLGLLTPAGAVRAGGRAQGEPS